MLKLATFSIAAHCPRNEMVGIGVSTAVPAVGGVCAFVAPNVGAVATQSWVNPYFGIDGLRLLRDGASAQHTLDSLLRSDEVKALRQLGVVDVNGGVAAFTGEDCTEWCGHEIGEGFTVQGNMLKGPETIREMARVARESAELDLPERLMRTLEAGQAAGGDKRGKQSAYIRIFQQEEYPYLSIGVDDNPDPVTELRRILEVAKAQFVPFLKGMPTRDDPLRALSAETTEMLLRSPDDRPVKS